MHLVKLHVFIHILLGLNVEVISLYKYRKNAKYSFGSQKAMEDGREQAASSQPCYLGNGGAQPSDKWECSQSRKQLTISKGWWAGSFLVQFAGQQILETRLGKYFTCFRKEQDKERQDRTEQSLRGEETTSHCYVAFSGFKGLILLFIPNTSANFSG